MSEHKRAAEDKEAGAEHKKAKTCNGTESYFKVEPYLFFHGNCAEVLDFYVHVFHGEKVSVRSFGDMPGGDIPEEYKSRVMHAVMTFQNAHKDKKCTIMMSDVYPNGKSLSDANAEHKPGNNVHLSLADSELEHVKEIWARFAANHKTVITMPFEKQFWGSIFGSLIDPFGIHWMFSSHDKSEPKREKTADGEPFPDEYFHLEPYFYFDGDCSSAVDYYTRLFAGKKTYLGLYKDGPMPTSEEWKDKVMHACMTFHDHEGSQCHKNTIMFSDVPQDKRSEHKVGGQVHLSIGATNFGHMKAVWDRFVADSKTSVTTPLAKQFWGDTFGSLKDAHGINWMFNCHETTSPETKTETKSGKSGCPESYFKVEAYFYFPGNCAEAIDFYCHAFNAKKTLVTTFGDNEGMSKGMSEEDKKKIMHASISFNDGSEAVGHQNNLMFSDVVEGPMCDGKTVGNNVQLSVGATNYNHMKACWDRFVANPKTVIKMPLQKQFWGSIYGNLIDPFGVHWMFSAPEDKAEK